MFWTLIILFLQFLFVPDSALKFIIEGVDFVDCSFEMFLLLGQLGWELLDFSFGGSQGSFFRFDFFVDMVEGVGTVDPHNHALAGGWCIFHNLNFQVGYVLGVVQIFAQIVDDTLIYVFYFELEQLVQQFGISQQFHRGSPPIDLHFEGLLVFDLFSGVGVHYKAQCFHDHSNDSWWFFHSFKQIDLFLFQHLQGIFCSFECRHGFSKILCAFFFDFIGSVNSFLHYFLFPLDTFLQDISGCFVLLHFFHLDLGINGSLFQFRLQFDQIFLHTFDWFLGLDDFIVAVFVFEDLSWYIFSFFVEQFLEGGNEFYVGGGGHVVMSFQFFQHLFWPLRGARVVELHHCYAFLPEFLFHFDWAQKFTGQPEQGILRPILEPVDCAAVDYWREHSHSSSEGISDRTESQNYV